MLTFGPSRDVSHPRLEPIHGLRRERAGDLWTGREGEPEKLSILRSRHRTLGRIDRELELRSDESRDAVHHPATRPFAADVDVAVVRIADKAKSPSLQLPTISISRKPSRSFSVTFRRAPVARISSFLSGKRGCRSFMHSPPASCSPNPHGHCVFTKPRRQITSPPSGKRSDKHSLNWLAGVADPASALQAAHPGSAIV